MDAVGNVWIRGLVASASSSSASTIFTLPPGYRPPSNLSSTQQGKNSTVTTGRVDVLPAGTVQYVEDDGGSGNWTYLTTQFSFPCADNSPGIYSCFPITARLKDGKKPKFVIANCANSQTGAALGCSLPAYTYLGTGQTGNLIRIDNIAGLPLGTQIAANIWVFF
jgi:hypothetical protein